MTFIPIEGKSKSYKHSLNYLLNSPRIKRKGRKKNPKYKMCVLVQIITGLWQES